MSRGARAGGTLLAISLAVMAPAAPALAASEPLASEAESPPSGADLLAAGAAAFEAGDYKAALKAFEKAAGDPERRAAALAGVARAQSALGRNEKALPAAEEAILAAAGSAAEEAAAQVARAEVRIEAAIDLWIEINRLSERPGKKKPTYGEQVDEDVALAEASYRRALELTEGAMREAWVGLAELFALRGRFVAARDELVLYFEHDEEGREAAADLLAHLECVSDVEDLAGIVHPRDVGVEPATKQFSPSPRLSGFADPEAKRPPEWRSVRVVGVVDKRGRFRCYRIVNAVDFPPEVVETLRSVLATWRFEPARVEGERRVAFFADTFEAFGRR